MAPRALWNGSLSFGLVNIPVGLYPAEQSKELSFELVDRRDLAPIGYQTYNKKTGREVDRDDTVKAYELASGKLVVLDEADFRRANVKATQTLEIVGFVELGEIDLRYFDRPYYVAPLERGAKAYALLRVALEKSGRAGVARVVIRSREHLAAVFPLDGVLVANLLRWSHELRDPAQLDLPGSVEAAPAELAMARQLIEAMSGPWQPEQYKDEYRRDLLALIRRKAKARGGEVEEEQPERQETLAEVVDLMALLKQSVAQGGGSRRGREQGAGRAQASSKKKGAARKATKKTRSKPRKRARAARKSA